MSEFCDKLREMKEFTDEAAEFAGEAQTQYQELSSELLQKSTEAETRGEQFGQKKLAYEQKAEQLETFIMEHCENEP